MKKYECKKCNKHFKKKCHFETHLHKKFPCDKIKKMLDPSENVSENINSQELIKISQKNMDEFIDENKCLYCDKIFTRKDSLIRHVNNGCKKMKKIKEQIAEKKEESIEKIIDLQELKDKNTELEKELQIIKKYMNQKEFVNIINHNENTNNIEKETLDQKNINYDLNKFFYDGYEFNFICVKTKIYFKKSNIMSFLIYPDIQMTFDNLINDSEKKYLKDILDPKIQNIDQNNNEMYITEWGVYELILYNNDKKEKHNDFKEFIFDKIIPSLKGYDSTTISSDIMLDTSFISSFYDTNSVSKYDKKNVIYLAVIGLHNNKLLIKYGESNDVYRREFKEHKRTYGNQFKIVFIHETDNKEKIENLFKMNIVSKKLNVNLKFKEKYRRELFLTSNSFTLDDAKKLMSNLIEDNPLESIKQKNNKIEDLEYQLKDHENLLTEIIEKEKTKQEKEKTKQLELEVELKRLELLNNENKSK